MRTPSATLIAAQQTTSRRPYIKMVFTSKSGGTTYDLSMDSAAYGNRIVQVDHNEEPYNEYAVVTLKDRLANLPDLTGYWTEIGYGLVTGAGNEYLGTQTPRLWVKHQRYMTVAGRLYTILELEGMWARLREVNITTLDGQTAPFYTKVYTATTPWDIMRAVVATTEVGFTMSTEPGVDDGIIDTLATACYINKQPFEAAAGILYRLISMTKCYLRPKITLAFEAVFPQAADADNETYYTNQAYYLYSYMERSHALAPNHIKVSDGEVGGITGEAVSQPDIDKYADIVQFHIAAGITNPTDANLLAAALLAKVYAEKDNGRLIVPHDGRVELYDRVAAYDQRQSPQKKYPTNTLARVAGLHHSYASVKNYPGYVPGRYSLEILLGGVSNTYLDDSTADITLTSKVSEKEPVGLPVGYVPPAGGEYPPGPPTGAVPVPEYQRYAPVETAPPLIYTPRKVTPAEKEYFDIEAILFGPGRGEGRMKEFATALGMKLMEQEEFQAEASRLFTQFVTGMGGGPTLPPEPFIEEPGAATGLFRGALKSFWEWIGKQPGGIRRR